MTQVLGRVRRTYCARGCGFEHVWDDLDRLRKFEHWSNGSVKVERVNAAGDTLRALAATHACPEDP